MSDALIDRDLVVSMLEELGATDVTDELVDDAIREAAEKVRQGTPPAALADEFAAPPPYAAEPAGHGSQARQSASATPASRNSWQSPQPDAAVSNVTELPLSPTSRRGPDDASIHTASRDDTLASRHLRDLALSRSGRDTSTKTQRTDSRPAARVAEYAAHPRAVPRGEVVGGYVHQRRFEPFVAMERRARAGADDTLVHSQRPNSARAARPRPASASAAPRQSETASRPSTARGPTALDRSVIYAGLSSKVFLAHQRRVARRTPPPHLAAPMRKTDVVARGQQMRSHWGGDGFLQQTGRSELRWQVRRSMVAWE